MDHFGIGHAMKAMASLYSNSVRRSGRTTSLLESLRDGDRVICHDRAEYNRLDRLFRQVGKKVEVRVVDPEKWDLLLALGPSSGRTVFAHSWVELHYQGAIAHACGFVDHWQKALSGPGLDSPKSSHRDAEQKKWVG